MTISPLPPSSHPDYNQTDIEGPMLSSLLAHLHPSALLEFNQEKVGLHPCPSCGKGLR